MPLALISKAGGCRPKRWCSSSFPARSVLWHNYSLATELHLTAVHGVLLAVLPAVMMVCCGMAHHGTGEQDGDGAVDFSAFMSMMNMADSA